ncbi:MAG: hypothetical protein ACWA5R_02110 [bacterium]
MNPLLVAENIPSREQGLAKQIKQCRDKKQNTVIKTALYKVDTCLQV